MSCAGVDKMALSLYHQISEFQNVNYRIGLSRAGDFSPTPPRPTLHPSNPTSALVPESQQSLQPSVSETTSQPPHDRTF